MTTDMGNEVSEQGRLGFGDPDKDGEMKKGKIASIYKKFFGTEFVNRVNSIVVFNGFTDKEKEDIARLFFRRLIGKLSKQKSIDLTYSDEIVPVVLEEAKKLPGINANPLEDVIMKSFISNIISNYIVDKKGDVKSINLFLKDGNVLAGDGLCVKK
jgi:ATP-dependent Clp protease ATP-binding subunit ClpA